MAISTVDTRALPIMPAALWRALIAELEQSGQFHLAARALAQYRRFYSDHGAASSGPAAANDPARMRRHVQRRA